MTFIDLVITVILVAGTIWSMFRICTWVYKKDKRKQNRREMDKYR